MSRPFTVSNTAGSLGDWLSLTPLLRHMRDAGRRPVVIALDSPHTRSFATLYQGLAEVEWAKAGEMVADTPEVGVGSFSQRILNAHGLGGANPIPYVEVSHDECMWAVTFLRDVTKRGPADLVAIAPSPGGARANLPDDHIANYRRWPAALCDRLIERQHSQRLLPIRFGTKGTQSHVYANHEEMEGVLTIPDLSLREVAACYAVIGRGIMTDTGDHHLMLAVGGTVACWVPPSTWFYDHAKHHYGRSAWTAARERPREVYWTYERAMPTIFS